MGFFKKLFGCGGESSEGHLAPEPKTLEEKLAALAACGFELREPFKVESLLESWRREDYEKPGLDLTLVGLGMEHESAPYQHHCINLWHFDTECIEDHGSYADIVNRMVELTQGSLVFQNIEDYVDIEEEVAWFSFTFNGETIKVQCAVDDDWVDTSVFGRFVFLLAQSDRSKLYVYYDLGGQDCMIGCVTQEQFSKLKQLSPKFEPLS